MSEKLNLYQKINQVMKAVKTVNKGSTVNITDSRSYKAVSHDDVTALLHDPITNNGIATIPNLDSVDLQVIENKKEYNGKITISNNYLVKVFASVTFVNIDNPTEQFISKSYAYAIDSGDKAIGKAYSMAVKYIYLKTFMLESQDEEESREEENKLRVSSEYTYQRERSTPSRDNKSYDNSTVRSNQAANSGGSNKEASEAQKKALDRLGVKYAPNISVKEASELIKSNQNKGK